MSTARYVHWQDQGMWLGYFEVYPDYLTQGESLEQLQGNLRDLYADLTSGEIPGIRKVAGITLGGSSAAFPAASSDSWAGIVDGK